MVEMRASQLIALSLIMRHRAIALNVREAFGGNHFDVSMAAVPSQPHLGFFQRGKRITVDASDIVVKA
jgi:hypothetical protein